MRYALIHPDGHVAGISELESPGDWAAPEGFSIVEAAGFEPDPANDLSVYSYAGGTFALDAKRLAESLVLPVSPQEVIKAIFASSPALTVGLVDSLAARIADYLPEWDAGTTYTLGCLAIKDGKVQRRTVGGAWREVA